MTGSATTGLRNDPIPANVIGVFPIVLESDDSPNIDLTVRPRSRPDGRACLGGRNRVHFVDGFDQARSGGARVHEATDIFAAEGTPIVATGPGRVIRPRTWDGLPSSRGGHALTIDHGGGWTTYYAHLRDEPIHRQGDRVAAGDFLGRVGRTGNAWTTCPHLHFSVERGGGRVNPFARLVEVCPYVVAGIPALTRAALARRSTVAPVAPVAPPSGGAATAGPFAGRDGPSSGRRCSCPCSCLPGIGGNHGNR